MITIPIVLLLFPMILSIIRHGKFETKALFSLFIIFAVFYILCIFLIIFSVLIRDIMYIATAAVFIYFLYEVYKIIKSWKNIDKKAIWKLLSICGLYIILTTIWVIFTAPYVIDAHYYSYISWESWSNNEPIRNILYRYNVFLYVINIFGFSEAITFFYIFGCYFFGLILFIVFIEVSNKMFNRNLGWTSIIIIAIMFSFFSSSFYGISLNWSVALFASGLVFLIIKNKEKNKLSYLDLGIIFAFNFSLSALVVAVIPIAIWRIIIFLRGYYAQIGLIFLYCGLSILPITGDTIEVCSVFLTCIVLSTLTFSFVKDSNKEFISYTNIKKYLIIVLNYIKNIKGILLFLADSYILLLITIWSILYFISGNTFFLPTSRSTVNYLIDIIFIILLLCLLNLIILKSDWDVLIWFMFLLVNIMIIYIAQQLFKNTLPGYISARLIWTIQSFMVFYLVMQIINWISLESIIVKKSYKIIFLSGVSFGLLTNSVFPKLMWTINSYHSYAINDRNDQWRYLTNKQIKYFQSFDFVDELTYSEVYIPSNTNYLSFAIDSTDGYTKNIDAFYYMYIDGKLNYQGHIKNQFPSWDFWHKNSLSNTVVNSIKEMDSKLKNSIFYDYIVLYNNSALENNNNIIKNYTKIESLDNIDIWENNEHTN